MKILTNLLIAVILLSLSIPGISQEMTGLQIMQKFEQQDKTNDTKADIKMTLLNDKGSERKRELTIWGKTNKDNTTNQLIKILTPADIAGTGFLSVETIKGKEDNWLYLPALRKTRRIVGSDKTGYFIGSDFTYEDLSSENISDFKYKYLGKENVDGKNTWKVEAIAQNPDKIKETGYSKRIIWVDEKTHLIIKAEFYAKDGTYTKLLKAEEIKPLASGKFRPFKITMENVQKGTKTILVFSDIQINKGIDDEVFSIRNLQRK